MKRVTRFRILCLAWIAAVSGWWWVSAPLAPMTVIRPGREFSVAGWDRQRVYVGRMQMDSFSPFYRTNGPITAYDVESGAIISSILTDADDIIPELMELDDRSAFLISNGRDRRIVDSATGDVLVELPRDVNLGDAVFSPDHRTLALSVDDGLHLYDLNRKHPPQVFADLSAPSFLGNRLLVAMQKNLPPPSDGAKGATNYDTIDVATRRVLRSGVDRPDENGTIGIDLIQSGDGRFLMKDSSVGAARVCSGETGETIWKLPEFEYQVGMRGWGRGFHGFLFGNGGKEVWVQYEDDAGARHLAKWDAATGRPIVPMPAGLLPSFNKPVYSSDGRFLLESIDEITLVQKWAMWLDSLRNPSAQLSSFRPDSLFYDVYDSSRLIDTTTHRRLGVIRGEVSTTMSNPGAFVVSDEKTIRVYRFPPSRDWSPLFWWGAVPVFVVSLMRKFLRCRTPALESRI
jgi:hypothetical protein